MKGNKEEKMTLPLDFEVLKKIKNTGIEPPIYKEDIPNFLQKLNLLKEKYESENIEVEDQNKEEKKKEKQKNKNKDEEKKIKEEKLKKKK